MKTLFILGNGFDLNLKMKTGFIDFYEYYINLSSDRPLIKELKKSINKDVSNWSNLELQFGKYLKNINSLEEFDEIYEDLLKNLQTYLKAQENLFADSEMLYPEFLNHLAYPEKFLPIEDKSEISTFKAKWTKIWEIDVVSFNYTKTLEKIIGWEGYPKKIESNSNVNIKLSSIIHIHGELNDLILGVNDVSQIDNSSLSNDEAIQDAIIKPSNNSINKNNRNSIFTEKIFNANLICIFGSSLGATDKVWWKLIGDALLNECILIIFIKKSDIEELFNYKRGRIDRDIKESFLSQTSLETDLKKEVKDKIYIAVNTEIFC